MIQFHTFQSSHHFELQGSGWEPKALVNLKVSVGGNHQILLKRMSMRKPSIHQKKITVHVPHLQIHRINNTNSTDTS